MPRQCQQEIPVAIVKTPQTADIASTPAAGRALFFPGSWWISLLLLRKTPPSDSCSPSGCGMAGFSVRRQIRLLLSALAHPPPRVVSAVLLAPSIAFGWLVIQKM